MEQKLQGKTAVVTGAGSGIGRAVSMKLAQMGCDVCVTDFNLKSAEETCALLPQAGAGQKHRAVHLDVTKKDSAVKGMGEIAKERERINILCNNAGVSSMQYLESMTEEEWDFNFNVNIKGMFFCTQAALPYMKEYGGRIVNMASMASVKGMPLLSHYAASKWAVVGFTKSIALELAPYKINANCICPGYVKTSMQERELEWESRLRGMTVQEVMDDYLRLTPFGELCLPEYIADTVGFLVSPESYFITGVALPVTGGADLL